MFPLPLKIAHFHGDPDPHLTHGFWATRVYIYSPNGTSTGSAVFAQFTVVSNTHVDRHIDYCDICCSGPHLWLYADDAV